VDVKPSAFFLAVLCFFPLVAQDPPSAIVYLYREPVRPGRMAKVVHIEEDAACFCATARCPNPYLAFTSITGPDEIWWINGFDSVDTMEKVWHEYAANEQIAQELSRVAENKADLVFPAQIMVARYRDDLSFSASTTFAYARFISISTFQTHPGQQSSFEKMRLALKFAHQRSGRAQWVYQVTSGTEDGTFLIMTPGRTMQELHAFEISDDRIPNVPDLTRESVRSSETRLYAVSPSMSMPAQSWLESDPDFWKRP
jgi:hypothetical protein